MSSGTTATRRPALLLGSVPARRSLGLVCAVLGLALALLPAGGGAGAEHPVPEVVGRVTVAPGQTLWDIAVTHAPAGTDPRVYLTRLRETNGFDGEPVPAWTVVLLPTP